MTLSKIILSLAVAFPLSILAQTSSSLSSQQGTLLLTVQDTSGMFIPMTVVYRRIPVLSGPNGMLAAGEFRYSGTLTTSSSAVSAALPVGTYLICPETGGTAYLDPCKWATAPTVVVSAGAVSSLSIPLSRGVRVSIAIDDPEALLSAADHPSISPPLIVGVTFGRGAFLGADCAATSGRVICSMAIPNNVPMSLWLFSRTFSLAAEDGTEVDAGGVGPAFQAAGSDLQFNFSVSGSKLKGVF